MSSAGVDITQLLENCQKMGVQLGQGQKRNGAFSCVLKEASEYVAAKQQANAEQKRETLSGDVRQMEGKALIQDLKKYFLSKGIPLDQVVANEEAVSSLKEFLVSAGFSPERVSEILESLKKMNPGQGVRLSDLLSRLENMEETEDYANTESLLELSMLPFLESILGQFLKNPEQQASALEGAKIDGEGVLVSRLISNLKRLVRNLEDNGKSIPDGQSRQQIAQLMRGLGMRSDQEIVTLERFIQELETLAVKVPESPGSRQIQIASLNRFIENLHNVNNQYGNMEKCHLSGKTQTAMLTDTKAMTPGRVIVDANAFLSKEAPMGDVKPLDNMKQGIHPSTGMESLTNMPERLFTPEQKSSVRTLPAYVMNQVGRQILRSLQHGNPEIRLQLKPPYLGRLQMRIDGIGDGMRVHIVTEHQGTKEMLLSHANELKSALAEQGIKLVKVDIQFDQSFEQSMANSGQDSEKMFHRRRKKSGFVLGEELEADMEDKPLNVRAGEGVLDLVA